METEQKNRKYAKGPANANWNGGVHINKGYIENRTENGDYKREHRAIAERALGKPIDARHPIHHHDENKQNNANSNLVICEDDRYHFLLHQRAEVLRAGYDPNVFKKCAGFGTPHYENRIEFGVLRVTVDGLNYSCKACCRAKGNRDYAERRAIART